MIGRFEGVEGPVTRERNRPIAVGLYEEHNGGVAAVRDGEVLLYSELERHTRKKNQAGWWPDLVGDLLETLPVGDIGAISCPRPDVVRDLLCRRFGARLRSDGGVDLGGGPVRLLDQDHRHPHLHFLSTLVLPEVRHGVYIVIVFDAGQPQIGWVDLREPVREPPSVVFSTRKDRAWYTGNIFATLFGKMFYGSGSLESCGKLMGMAGWGRVSLNQVAALRELAQRNFNHSVPRWQGYWHVDPEQLDRDVRSLFRVSPRDHDDSRTLDLAAAAQELFRHELAIQVEEGVERVHSDLACRGLPPAGGVLYAGGCALSVVTNETIRRIVSLPLIIPPYSHDAGQFVGGAVHGAIVADALPLPLGQGWRGVPCHSSGRITACAVRTSGYPAASATPAEVARRIAGGQLIGCLSGGAEAGPRALGHRSLIASAVIPELRDRLNHQVKHREWYRPFAPMLQVEAFREMFDEPSTPCARYMLDSFSFRPHLRGRFSSVSSPDGVSRAQAVDAATSPFLHQVLGEVAACSGSPIMLNTSLNAPGLPIAHDLDQSLSDCRSLGLDAVLFHDDSVAGASTSIIINLK